VPNEQLARSVKPKIAMQLRRDQPDRATADD
jgi:hypothetical protein